MTRLETTAYKPNGLAISPDGKLLYVADNGEKRWVLLALALDENGDVSQPRVIHNFGADRGIDGMTVTTGGRIVAAAGAVPGVLSPEGNILAIIPTPESPANVEFGGEDRKTLYIMAGKSLYRIRTTMTGFHIWPPRR